MENMNKYFSKKVESYYKTGDSMSTFALASNLERSGQKIYHMEIGMPNFDTPDSIKENAIEAIKEGDVYYTHPAGVYELRKAISDRIKEKYDIYYDPESEILVTAGASEALYLIWIAFLNEGEEVLIPSPYYYSYGNQVLSTGAEFVEVPILKDGEMGIDISEFEKRVSDRTKLLLVNSPSNPTGYVMSKKELQALADFAVKHDLIVVSDECYEEFLFGEDFVSISHLPGMKDRTLVLNSTSKTFSMTGWRVGYIAGNEKFISVLRDAHEDLNICPTSFAQEGAVKAFSGEIDEVKMMYDAYDERRKYIVNVLNDIDEISFYEPKGAFYVFFDVSKLGVDGHQFCIEMLKEKGVAFTPGESFGADWKNYVRMTFCASMEDIKEAMKLVKEYIAEKNN